LRVVVDGRLRTSPRARCVRQRSTAETLIATTAAAPLARLRALTRAGAEVVVVPGRGRYVALDRLLAMLAARGVVSVLIEGGGVLAAAALRARVVDRALVVAAPIFLGADARPMLGAMGVTRLAAAPRLVDERLVLLGRDLVRDSAVQY
jgi:diaminohydroxyphosphoribosylaminopyrimidine deaminase/5-amino-6-(5-phosphoribosylamino)uracil reductase